MVIDLVPLDADPESGVENGEVQIRKPTAETGGRGCEERVHSHVSGAGTRAEK